MFAVLGIIFLSIAFMHHKLGRYSHFTDSIFLLIEAGCLAIIALDFFHEGKKAYLFVTWFTAIMYVVVAFIKYSQKKNKIQNHN